MQIYHYSRNNGEYVGQSAARPDPLEQDKHLIPAQATTIEPPAARQGYARVFDGQTWIEVEDNRGDYFDENGKEVKLKDLGPIPAGWTTEPPTIEPEVPPEEPTESEPPLTPEEALEFERTQMVASPIQIRLALNALNLRDQVETAAASNVDAKVSWDYANQIHRTSNFIEILRPDVINPATNEPITPEEIDELFRMAMALHP